MTCAEPTVNFGGHCCACSVVCHHIGPMVLCAMHQARTGGPVTITRQVPVTCGVCGGRGVWSAVPYVGAGVPTCPVCEGKGWLMTQEVEVRGA